MIVQKIGNTKLSPRSFSVVVTLAILFVTLFEWRALYNLDHPKTKKVSCIGCHSDKHTLEAIANKAGDSLYLVHSGQLSLAELNRLTGKQNDPVHSHKVLVQIIQKTKVGSNDKGQAKYEPATK